MSAIAGFHNTIALPEWTRDRLPAVTRASRAHAPDGDRSVCRGKVAMAFSAFHITAESRRAHQPLELGDLLLAWDGRLDNRSAIESLLPADHRGSASTTDAELVASLYETLGKGAFGRLVGDFAFALWDGRRERLYLVRDAMGARPLFYCEDDGTLLWASSLSALFAGRGSVPEVDDDWLGAYLLRVMPSDRTPYRGVQRVPAGSMLIADRSGLRSASHWTLGECPEIRYSSDADYEEHFRALFFDAVRSRMRTGGSPLCSELSGGLDSSSVACVAHHLLHAESVEASDLLTYSIVYDRASTADEREYIGAVEKRLGKPGIHLLEDDHPMLAEGFEQPWAEIPYFLQTLRAPHIHAGQRLAETGTRMVLTGAGGDQLMWNDIEAPFYLADLARDGQIRELGRQLHAWHHRPARSQYPQPLPQLVLRGLFRPIFSSLRGRGRPYAPLGLFPYLSPKLASLYHQTWKQNNPPLRGIRPSRLPPVEDLRDVITHVGWFYHFERLGFQMSHPFLHRPFVEFCLGIPNEQFVRVDETRSLQRRALRDLLPRAVLERRTKVGPDEAILRGLRREWSTIERLLDGSRVCARGFARPGLLHAAMERASGGFAPCNMDLVRLLEVEIWLRGQETGMASSTQVPSPSTAESPAVVPPPRSAPPPSENLAAFEAEPTV